MPNPDPSSGEDITVGALVSNGDQYRDEKGRRHFRFTARVIALHPPYAWINPVTGSHVNEGPPTFKIEHLFNVEGVNLNS